MDEEIKKNWNDTKFHSMNDDCAREILNGKRSTALQGLAKRYRWFSNMALIMLIWFPLMMTNRLLPDDTRLYFCIAFAAYFLICSVMDRWLYLGISRIDCATMPVSEVSRLALFYRKRHLQFILILIPLMVALIGALIHTLVDDIYFVVGAVFGGIVGLAIGIRQFMEFMSDYRKVIS